jgi:NAD(P)-dependent dehydrogenase (short-subunit alcohol dehydrogenase family)
MNNSSIAFGARATATDVLAGVDLRGKRVVVTGGASGLGLETSRALLAAGAEVTAAVRRPLDVALPGLAQLPLDLSDLASVRRFAETWEGPLDVLVANAGIMAVPTRELSAEGWELQLATNFLGHFALAHHLRRALAAAQGARIVVVSSGAHRSVPVDLDDLHFDRRPYDRWLAYGQSKSADILLAVAAATRWADDGVVANALNPGYILTGLQRHVDDDTMRAMGAMDDEGNLVEPDYFKTPEQGASTAVLLAGSPTVRGITGRYFEDNQPADVVADGDHGVAPHAVDPATADRLWALAEDVVGRAG